MPRYLPREASMKSRVILAIVYLAVIWGVSALAIWYVYKWILAVIWGLIARAIWYVYEWVR